MITTLCIAAWIAAPFAIFARIAVVHDDDWLEQELERRIAEDEEPDDVAANDNDGRAA